MNAEFTEEWLKAYSERTGIPVDLGDKSLRTQSNSLRVQIPATAEDDAPKRNKYGNVRCEGEDGFVYDSKHEKRVWDYLRLRAKNGEFIALGRQVPFYLPGGVKYVADFVGFLPGGGYEVFDAKSESTKKNSAYRIKKRLMAQCLGIEIREV